MSRVHTTKSRITKYTPAEIRVANLLAEGYSNKKIATILNVHENTVKFHITTLLYVSESESRGEFIAKFYKNPEFRKKFSDKFRDEAQGVPV